MPDVFCGSCCPPGEPFGPRHLHHPSHCPHHPHTPLGLLAWLHGLIGHQWIQPGGICTPMHCSRCGADRNSYQRNKERKHDCASRTRCGGPV